MFTAGMVEHLMQVLNFSARPDKLSTIPWLIRFRPIRFLPMVNLVSPRKYQTLSAGIKSTGLGENVPDGYDILLVSGYGPFTIPINGIVKVAFALIGGDSLTDLQASAVAAQKKYDELNNSEIAEAEDGFVLRQNFPNPGLDQTVIEFSLSRPGLTNLILYNAAGQPVRELIRDNLAIGSYRVNLDLSELQSGVYLYKLQFEGKEKTLKLLVTK
jgi:serine protease